MSRWRFMPLLLAAFAAAIFAQETNPSNALPASPDVKAGAQSPDPQELPPEEDSKSVKQEYSFNPVRSRRDVEVGTFYFKKGDWKAASARFKEATLWNEGNAEAWLRWGETEERRGVKTTAKAAYEKYIEIAPEAKNIAEIRKRVEKLK